MSLRKGVEMRKIVMCALMSMTGFVANAADEITWMVYCEGAEQGQAVAYMTRTNWTADMHEARSIAEAASDMFGAQGRRPIHGCSSVPFEDVELANYRREQTASLHERFGTRVEFFDLPEDVMAEVGSFELVSRAFARRQ